MSIFPTGRRAESWRPAATRALQGQSAEELARPIHGEIYEIEEKDLDALMRRGRFAPPSGLVSRH